MATLAPSLRLLFAELNARWPNRDRRTDGWYRNCQWRGGTTSDHCYDWRGRVHAADIDKDGINAEWIFDNICENRLPTNYVIWNRRIRSRAYGWRVRRYTGTSNPHIDHVHVSIMHSDRAWFFNSGWGIARATTGMGSNPSLGLSDSWDYYPHVVNVAGQISALGSTGFYIARSIRGLRR